MSYLLPLIAADPETAESVGNLAVNHYLQKYTTFDPDTQYELAVDNQKQTSRLFDHLETTYTPLKKPIQWVKNAARQG